MTSNQFQTLILEWYRKNGRHHLPWRKTHDPYSICVSELMLQQTQVDRVILKFNDFLKRFPTIEKLARARNASMIKQWQGLGYNRRALFLKRACETVVRDFYGKFPQDVSVLETLPGIGPYTARAISVFAFNKPEVFIETNIRRVYIHFFFSDAKKVSDADLYPIIQKTFYKKNPRLWYSALMDYGALALKDIPNPNRKSKHYTKQSKFEGSNRKVRGEILKLLTSHPGLTERQIQLRIKDKRVKENLETLTKEGFLKTRAKKYFLS